MPAQPVSTMRRTASGCSAASKSATRPPKEWAMTSQPTIFIRRINAQISSMYSVTDQGAGGSGLLPWPGKSTT